MSRKALGKGLGALIPSAEAESPASVAAPVQVLEDDPPREVPVRSIRTNPYQPRTVFDPEALEDLTNSVRQNGLIQPLVVRAAGDGYELIAGERRYLAAKNAGLQKVPVVVREASRREMLEVALVENVQREDLNPVEEAEAYQRLASEFGLTQEEIATRVGKSRVAITNSLRLLGLEKEIRNLISEGALSAGHARAVLAVEDAGRRMQLVREITTKGLSVREAEALARNQKPRESRKVSKKRSHPALEAWEERLRNRYGTQVRIVGGVGRGRVEIHYFNESDLERIIELSGVPSSL